LIVGEGIRLRAIEKHDLPLFVEWFNDPQVLEGLLVYLPISQEEEESWYTNMLKRPGPEHVLGIDLLVDEEWNLIGSCGFHDIDWRCRSGEIGISIGDKRYWNKGFGTQAVRLLVNYGFNTLNLNRIALDVYENNPRAIRAYEKVGFVHEGRKRQAMFKNGQYMDILLMSLLRSEWQDER
jgi:RimJ/RimL family protein N-acetyltransferase